MGRDGAAGLAAIKAVGGLTLAQQPDTALFASMPEQAIATGGVKIVATAETLPTMLLKHLPWLTDWLPDQVSRTAAPGHVFSEYPTPPAGTSNQESTGSSLIPILQILQQQTKHDFSHYKLSTLQRRIERRMIIHHQTELTDYIELLQQNPQEAELLFKELLIGVTGFFRDAPVWQQLTAKVLPELLQNRQHRQLRAWVVGCSTGEEAYTLAMCLLEATAEIAQPPDQEALCWQIFATDLSVDAIATARRGFYPLAIAEQVSEARLSRFFQRQQQGYQINPEVRDMVLFAQHNVLQAPPFTRLDLISCRNLLIYFDAALQRKLLPLFHYALRPASVLLLGSSETVGRDSHLFTPLDARLRLFLRQDVRQQLLSRSSALC